MADSGTAARPDWQPGLDELLNSVWKHPDLNAIKSSPLFPGEIPEHKLDVLLVVTGFDGLVQPLDLESARFHPLHRLYRPIPSSNS